MDLYIIDSDLSRKRLFVAEAFAPEFEYKNAAVDLSSIPGAISFNQRLPIEGNASILKQVHHIETRSGDLLYNMEGYVSGELKVRGKLLIEESSWRSEDDHYTVSFIATDFASIIESKTLKQFLEGVIINIKGAAATLIDALNSSIADVNAPLKFPTYNNIKHFNEANLDFDGVINSYSDGDNSYIENASEPVGDLYENKRTFAPFVRTLFMLEQIFNKAGYRLDTRLDETDFNKVIEYTGFSLDYLKDVSLLSLAASPGNTNQYLPWSEIIESTMDVDPAPPTIYPYVIETEGLLQIDLRLNVGAASTATFTLALDLDDFPTALQWSNLAPNQVHNLTGTFDSTGLIGSVLAIRINPLNSSEINVLAGTSLTIKNITESSEMLYYEEVPLSRLAHNMGVAEYLMAVRTYFGLKFIINPVTSVVKIEYCVDALERPFKRLTGILGSREQTKHNRPVRIKMKLMNEPPSFDETRLIDDVTTFAGLSSPVIGQVVRILNRGAVFRYDYDQENASFGWRELGKSNTSVEWGDGREEIIEIPAELVTLQSVQGGSLVPSLDEEGSSDAYGSTSEQNVLRFMMFWGLQEGVLGIEYPFASPHNYDSKGNELDGMALDLSNSPNSIFVKLHQDWLPVLYSPKTIERQYTGAIDPESITAQPLLIENQLFIPESVIKSEAESNEVCVLKLRRL